MERAGAGGGRKRALIGAAAALSIAALLGVASAQTHVPVSPGQPARALEDRDAGAPFVVATVDAGRTSPLMHLSDAGRVSPLTPTANEFPGGLITTSAEYDKLLGDIVALRARVAAAADALFQSRLMVRVQSDGGHGKILHLILYVDDGAVWSSPNGSRFEDSTLVYDHSSAPGKHTVEIEVERADDRDESYRSKQKSKFVVEIPRDQKLDVNVRVSDESTMGGDFSSDRSGTYDLRIRVRAKAESETGRKSASLLTPSSSGLVETSPRRRGLVNSPVEGDRPPVTLSVRR